MPYDLLIDCTMIALLFAFMIWARLHFGSIKGMVTYTALGLCFGVTIVALDLTGHYNMDILAALALIIACEAASHFQKRQARKRQTS